MGLDELLENVEDEKSFLEFVKALYAERLKDVELEKANPSSNYGPTHKGWENVSIEGFLGASIAWVEDTDFGRSQGNKQENPWYKFALFLYSGKIYE